MSISHAKVDEISRPIVDYIIKNFKEQLPDGITGIDAAKIMASVNLNICVNIIEGVKEENRMDLKELEILLRTIKKMAIESYLYYLEQPSNDAEIGEEKNETN